MAGDSAVTEDGVRALSATSCVGAVLQFAAGAPRWANVLAGRFASATMGPAATPGIVDGVTSDPSCAASNPAYGARQAATAKRASEPGRDDTVAFAMRR